ncbi:MAG: hydroxyethylthiazole kinase [Armatimonadetes bacterium]|nr:hydroxyethylthiazole kinase [Armatimonadota bacterium]
MDIVSRICDDLRTLRANKPLIHSITNFVVMNETANAILCLGALPVMAHAREEVEEMVSMAGALVLNIGTLEPGWVDAMESAGRQANKRGIPVILDPVGAGATRLRTESSKRLLDNLKISIVRGNPAEISAIIGIASEIRGVESIGTSEVAESTAERFASTFGCTVAITGAVDVVSDGRRTAKISNGHPMLGKVVGTGCMSDVIIASFAAVEPDPFLAAIGGLVAFGIAGELAAEVAQEKPGTFHMELYNSLYALDPDTIRARARIHCS